jgi:hypothetical protein
MVNSANSARYSDGLERWFCLDCVVTISLNEHGRCENCDGDAVVSEHRNSYGRTYNATTSVNMVPVGRPGGMDRV